MSSWHQICLRLEPVRTALLEHAVYERLDSLPAIRVFMQHHQFAVWDFMSLLKALQRAICCVEVPWVPPADPVSARFVNEIVLAEETDEVAPGRYASHFDLYVQAMQEAGADLSSLRMFLESLRAGQSVAAAAEAADLPPSVRRFLQHTFDVLASGDLAAIAAAFTFGREDLLPGLFQRVVDRVNDESSGQLTILADYLRRHIELDGDSHGPLAQRLVETLCGGDASRWQSAEQAGLAALQARLELWDGIAAELNSLEHSPARA